MRHLGCYLITFLVLAALTACTDDVLSPSQDVDSNPDRTVAVVQSTDAFTPHSVLTGIRSCETLDGFDGCSNKAGHRGRSSDFGTPLFGLATAPNDDILVADAGAGVATRHGTIDIPLLGISSIGPIGHRSLWATEGLIGAPGDSTGQALYRLSKGHTERVADLFSFEQMHNPDGTEVIDSNPFDVHSLGGRSALVVDAGGNDLLEIDNQGHIRLRAIFPDELVSTENIKEVLGCPESGAEPCGLPSHIPAQAVPTSVAVGPDGDYFVGELKGLSGPDGCVEHLACGF